MKILRLLLAIVLMASTSLAVCCCDIMDIFPTPPTETSIVYVPVYVTPTPSVSEEAVESGDPTETTPLYMAVEDVDFSTFLFVGDSRTVGMATYVPMNTIAEVGVGYNFLMQHRSEILRMENMNIVFNLGVNDLTNLDNYIEFFQSLPEEFTWNNNLYVVSVNPCSGEYAYKNDEINYFNVQLSDSLPSLVRYIDTNSYLTEVGFESPDGLHYSASTYQTIAVLIYNNIEFYQYQGY
ncbi:MAG: SGNH/GDSL hydrolase family protein [Saccharofermentans sp.]|nr:SGNH/GDSL hydrolase family protein [Saccharofermentans sp.]